MVTDLDLSSWQQRLDAHFTELAARRKTAFPGRPIFALEHGLDQPDIELLSAALRLQITKKAPTQDQSLTWVVYASEVGYRYSGDEYWQTFEKDTPGWILNGDRYWLRHCFLSFCEKYGGAQPSGTWADHFSIICWPITHAILPRDLQRQLARILYEIRHSYSTEFFEFPQALGELIAARSWNTTSRFQNFVQETSLVGQIAVALLLEAEPGSATQIDPKTLQRIGADLDRERRGREWLRSARRFAKTGARIRALAPKKERAGPTVLQTEEARAQVAALGIEPRLILLPTEVGESRWSVSCEIPDLSHLLLRFPDVRDVLTGSRCVVAGAAGTPLARGRCLYGAQRVRLARWPRPEEVLLQFERGTPQLEYLLRTGCLLKPGPVWLFRIASDGIAYEMRSLKVRPNHRYIVLRTDRPPSLNEHVRTIDLECAGAFAALLTLPAALTCNWEEALRGLGLQQAKTVEVWPAGLAPAEWDAEACGDWLVSDRPCFAVRPDHSVDVLSLCLKCENTESQLELKSLAAGEPIFIQLPQLAIGIHKLILTAHSIADDKEKTSSELEVVMRVREPRAWRSGLSPSGALLVHLDPPAPTLEQLWEGEADMTVNGPLGRHITCFIALHETEDAPAILQKTLPPLQLPVSASSWRMHCDKFFRQAKDVQDAFDDARMCFLHINASEFGGFQLRCDREFKPVRWSVRRNGPRQIVRLIDDSGDNANPSVVRMTFDNPMSQTALTVAQEYDPPTSGGLFVARKGTSIAAVVAPPTIRDLGDLACKPAIAPAQRTPDAVMQALQISALWTEAKLPGDILSAMRRHDVLLALAHHVAELICGAKWAQAEVQARAGERQFSYLQSLISKRPEHAGLTKRLEEFCIAFANADAGTRIAEFVSIASQFGLVAAENNVQWTSELALRLASDPGNIENLGGARVREGVKRLMEEATALARSARFVVLTIDHRSESEKLPNQLYKDWLWR